jgi:hypothetical protein
VLLLLLLLMSLLLSSSLRSAAGSSSPTSTRSHLRPKTEKGALKESVQHRLMLAAQLEEEAVAVAAAARGSSLGS